MRRIAVTSALAVLGLAALVACGDSDETVSGAAADATTSTDATPSTTSPDDAATTTTAAGGTGAAASLPTVTGDAGEKPSVEVSGGDPPTELVVEDLIVGTGEEATAGTEASVQYLGVLHSDGSEFDTSWDEEEPFAFTIGAAQVIPGWDQGVEGMKVGGRRLLVVPPDLAYGDTGVGPIGPEATLVFVVDLVDVQPAPPVADPADEPEVPLPATVPTELVVEDLVEGDGEVVEAGDKVVLNYAGATLSTGEVFDSSWQRGQAVVFPIGEGSLIPGWDQGVLGMKEGGRRVLVIPPDLAYGAEGSQSGAIGPDETLVFVIDVIEVRK